MNNKCPTCGSSYNLTPQHAGRSFTCQRCQSQLLVQPDGLHLAGQPVQAAPPAPPDAYADYGGEDDYDRAPSRPRSAASSSPIIDFLLFRRMIVPIMIHVIFWIGVTVAVLWSLIFPIVLMQQMGAVAVIFIPIFLVLSLLYVRIICELLFLPFRINETLTDILNQLKRNGGR